jgi:hypothetical protein
MNRRFNALAVPLIYAGVLLALLIFFLGTCNAYASTCAVPGVYATIQAAINDNKESLSSGRASLKTCVKTRAVR